MSGQVSYRSRNFFTRFCWYRIVRFPVRVTVLFGEECIARKSLAGGAQVGPQSFRGEVSRPRPGGCHLREAIVNYVPIVTRAPFPFVSFLGGDVGNPAGPVVGPKVTSAQHPSPDPVTVEPSADRPSARRFTFAQVELTRRSAFFFFPQSFILSSDDDNNLRCITVFRCATNVHAE